jgi:hypothetical protein
MKAILYSAVLFFLFSPGVLFYVPSKNHYLVIGIHAILFGLLLQGIHQMEESFTVANPAVSQMNQNLFGPFFYVLLFMGGIGLLACPSCAVTLLAISGMR